MDDRRQFPIWSTALAGRQLDTAARSLNILRRDGETDEDLRARLMVFIDSRRAPKDREWAR